MLYIFVANVIVFVLLSVIWNSTTWANVFIKVAMICLSVANAFMILSLLGYVVSVNGMGV